MKNKRIRLVAVLLTLAMAFSICALPASAASAIRTQNTWALGAETTNAKLGYMWMSEVLFREGALEGQGDVDDDTLTAAMALVKLGAKQEAADTDGEEFYEGTIPSNAYVGFSQTKSSRIYWYTKELYEAIDTDEVSEGSGSLDWSTGTLAYTTTDGTKKQFKAINGRSASSGGSSDSGAVLLLAGGAVVAGVGIYLYTHPAVVQKIKNFFAGNSATETVAESAEAAAESETAAENAAELPAEVAPAA